MKDKKLREHLRVYTKKSGEIDSYVMDDLCWFKDQISLLLERIGLLEKHFGIEVCTTPSNIYYTKIKKDKK